MDNWRKIHRILGHVFFWLIVILLFICICQSVQGAEKKPPERAVWMSVKVDYIIWNQVRTKRTVENLYGEEIEHSVYGTQWFSFWDRTPKHPNGIKGEHHINRGWQPGLGPILVQCSEGWMLMWTETRNVYKYEEDELGRTIRSILVEVIVKHKSVIAKELYVMSSPYDYECRYRDNLKVIQWPRVEEKKPSPPPPPALPAP